MPRILLVAVAAVLALVASIVGPPGSLGAPVAAATPAAATPVAASGQPRAFDANDPRGDLAVVASTDGTVQIIGWAVDENAFAHNVAVRVAIDGVPLHTITANRPSPYLYAYGVPGQHAYWTATRLTPGQHEACVVFVNVGAGRDSEPMCRSFSIADRGPRDWPQGTFTARPNDGTGRVEVSGWAFDHSQLSASVQVDISVDGVLQPRLTADGPSPYLYPFGVPGQHAFAGSFHAGDGPHRVCVRAIDHGPGADLYLGCQDVTVAGVVANPEGRIELGMQSTGAISLRGWAFDRSDLGSPITLAVFQDGSLTNTFTANGWSPELHPYGVFWKGIDATFAPRTRSAPMRVCVAGINIGAGANTWLACTDIDARGTAGAVGSTTDPNSIHVLVNKRNPLNPISYVPGDLVSMSSLGVPSLNGHSLRSEAASAMQRMYLDARAVGITLDMTSGYRSYQLQQQLYDGYVQQLGQAAADLTSARPGYSEHQTGLVADISARGEGCVLEACFANTTAGRWLAENSWRYGFILRYPDGMTGITGFEYEPWHFRYVGVDTATAMHDARVGTYEEWIGAPPAPSY